MTRPQGSPEDAHQSHVLFVPGEREHHVPLNNLAFGMQYVQDSEELRTRLVKESCTAIVLHPAPFDRPASELIELVREISSEVPIVLFGSEEYGENERKDLEGRAVHIIESDAARLETLLLSFVREQTLLSDCSAEECCHGELDDFSEQYEVTSAELDAAPLTPEIFVHLRRQLPEMSTLVLQIELAFQEALFNAHEHGNLELRSSWREEIDEQGRDKYSKIKEQRLKDPHYAKRQLEISLQLADNILRIEIRDQGSGFSYDSYMKGGESLEGDEVVQVHGRGIKLMNLVMSSVEYSDGGRCVSLSKSFRAE
ncbi:ATP-binding protein [bacterium]|nr:ATP-binding protein [bacterium]